MKTGILTLETIVTAAVMDCKAHGHDKPRDVILKLRIIPHPDDRAA